MENSGSTGGAVRAPFAANIYLRSSEGIEWEDGTGGTAEISRDYERCGRTYK